MIQTSILEQFDLFFKLFLKQSNKYLILLVASLTLILLILANKFKNKKITKIICYLVYIAIFSYLIYTYNNEIFHLFDYLMDNLFLLLFFPNLAVYILILIITNVFLVKSTFSTSDSLIKKSINIFFFLIFNIIFYFIINNIITNNINVYEELSIYTNSELLNLIELNMKVFLIWLLVLLIINFVNKINSYIENRNLANNPVVFDDKLNSSEFDKIQPVNTYNIYNDYLDVMPIKKAKKVMEPILEIEPKVLPTKEIIEYEPLKKKNKQVNLNKAKPIEFASILDSIYEKNEDIKKVDKVVLPTLDEVLEENKKTKTEFYIKETQPKKLDIDLSSYDDIFVDYQTPDKEFENNMDQVFSTNNNYLEKLLYDVENLRNNQDDKNSIQDIYFKIKTHQNELSLNDYNYLINRLLEIKNS